LGLDESTVYEMTRCSDKTSLFHDCGKTEKRLKRIFKSAYPNQIKTDNHQFLDLTELK